MTQYFPKPYEPFGRDINVTVDSSNYATKPYIKNITRVDKLDIDKFVSIPADLSKSSNVVKNKAVKKTEYDAKIKNIEVEMPDISNLATKSNLNTKINEIRNKIPSITGLATTSTWTSVENKIPSISNLVKKNRL